MTRGEISEEDKNKNERKLNKKQLKENEEFFTKKNCEENIISSKSMFFPR